jgi:hypothetical protein
MNTKCNGARSQLLIISAIAGDFTAFAKQDEVVGTVPVLNDIQTFVDFTSECRKAQVATEKNCTARFAELG